jgi:hypothetical protein
MYQLQWISVELYNVSFLILFIVLAMIFERMRRTARDFKADESGNDIVYWQRQVT